MSVKSRVGNLPGARPATQAGARAGVDAKKPKQIRTTSVLFVEFTRGGELQKKMRDT